MSFDDYGKGQCINCGFLGKRMRNPHFSECREATPWERAEGHIGDKGESDRYMPWCFINKAHLARETSELVDDRPITEKVGQVITRPRDCDGWYPWTEGLDPKEHYEEHKMRQLEESRRQFEQRLAEDKRNWEKWLAEREIKERAESDRVMRRLVIIGIILAILQLVGAFLASALFSKS